MVRRTCHGHAGAGPISGARPSRNARELAGAAQRRGSPAGIRLHRGLRASGRDTLWPSRVPPGRNCTEGNID
jgi:hypothetical protein